ncbi:MAG: LytTR family transcriptional regulator DNA-binding domain-containing protein [Marinifilaceae bacterium]|jgi:two-component system LytT family response regulator|nr:LytTR family transcriptional regulator DNA-binding domain-containing protein [Marinifilaceae bacterium]
MNKISAIIIDDESLSRNIVREYAIRFQDIEIIGEYSNGFDGVKAINELKPDIVYLDIQMPKLDGFEMLELISHKCNIIFITAYNQYALKAFEHNAVDYLLKPLDKSRFEQATEKAIKLCSNKKDNKKQIDNLSNQYHEDIDLLNRVVVKSRNKIDIIAVEKIMYFEAQDDYVMIYTKTDHYLKQKTMKYFEAHLDSKRFCRIHRSFIVNIDFIDQLQPYEKDSWLVVLKTGKTLKISRSGLKLLKKLLEF